MPVFLIVVLVLALIALVAMLVVRSRASRTPNPRSKQRAKRESAEVQDDAWPAEVVPVSGDAGDDAPRMPMGDLPPRPSRRRK
ncbi:hypothetical protein [Sporichthya sp.]|uniref:hypothetical protein n=1 Tax=Sporichthya sp. TaxID=65475 RepID=UPI0018426B47|nr:hypothetical protein [Sporichthya sp.]MBA3742545.1 hypothetical protein [Sporichthya sp.]